MAEIQDIVKAQAQNLIFSSLKARTVHDLTLRDGGVIFAEAMIKWLDKFKTNNYTDPKTGERKD